MSDKPKKKPEHKFDIFHLLGRVNAKDWKYVDSLTEEDQKHVNPYMVMRWMAGSNDARQVVFLNELVNKVVWGIPSDHEKKDHFRLKMYLLGICGTKKSSRFQWIKTQTDKKKPLATQIVKEYFHYSTRDAQEALELLSAEDVIDYAEQLGYQVDHVKKLKKELS